MPDSRIFSASTVAQQGLLRDAVRPGSVGEYVGRRSSRLAAVARLLERSYRTVANKRMITELDNRPWMRD
jgi:hypothetical protein